MTDPTPPVWPPAPAESPAATPAASPAALPAAPAAPLPAASPQPALEVPVTPVSPVRAAPRRRRGLVDVVLVVATIFAVSGIGFAIGRITAPATAAATAGRGTGQFQGNGPRASGAPNGQFPGGGQGGFGQGAGAIITGEVVEVTADHLTLKLANGQSIQIPLTATTTYHSQAPATAADVTPGSTVHVQVSRGGAGGSGGTGGPAASGGPGNGRGFGAASDITVVPK